MAIGNLFKQQKHKQFEYRPVFYDPDKEELQNRIKKAQEESRTDKTYVPNIKGKMKEYLISDKKSKASIKNIRLIIIVITLALLALMFYYIIEITTYIMSNIYDK